MSVTLRIAAIAVCAAANVALAEGPHTYTLSEAVDLALSQNPSLTAVRREAGASRAGAGSARGHLLPVVKLGFTYDYVRANEGLNLGAFSAPSASGEASPPYRINFWGGDFNVTVAQPVLGLLHIGQDFAAADRAADASQANVSTGEQDLRTNVELGLLQLFQARAEKGIAQASHDQLADQLKVAQAEYKDGALTNADVLRFQVAAANAAQQVIQAQVDEDNAKDQLLGLLGLLNEDRSTIEFADPTEDLGRRELPKESDRDLQGFAEGHRPELIAAQDTADAAWHRKQSGFLKLLPEFNVSYSYYRLINVPSAFPTDINLFGLGASWNVWDWGATYFAARSAGEELEVASAQRESLRQQVDVEVRTRGAQERAAASAVQVASDTIAQAEEAFRVTQATVKAGAATTTDLLDAQAALTQARLNLVRSRYQELRARTALFRALGSAQG